jgi:broad specificity phosphatase PhoE
MLIRHGQSAYNVLRAKKQNDPLYIEFKARYKAGDSSPSMLELARKVKEKYALGIGDHRTPLTLEGEQQAIVTGEILCSENKPLPDVVIYSPYLRTIQTLEGLCTRWPELRTVRHVEDDRIREQEHGLSVIYNDWRVFHTFHREQRELKDLQGNYWYQYPQGESVAQVRDRVRSMLTTLVREYSGKRVLMVTHHLTILSIRATIERLTPEGFLKLDKKDKPLNCGVTEYVGDPNKGHDGKLILESYNRKLY